ncbi:Protein argonaute-3 [Echinococcus granulosus]|nr:Protein argonaute-3 [Echinococcus granulosus]
MSLSVAGDDASHQQIGTASPGDSGELEIAAESRPVTFKEDRMLPSRPGGGTIGRKIVVEVNCWDFDVSDVSVLMYDITLTKLLSTDGKEIKLKEKGIGKYVRLIAERKRGDVFHDGGRILFSLGPLDGKDGEMLNFSEKIADPLQNDDLTIEYAAKRVGSISARQIREYLDNSRSKTSDLPQPAINMLDNLIKWVNRASLPYLSKSAIFYDRPERDNTGGLFWIYRGYSLSFRPQWKCRLNIDMAHRAFFPAGNLADILYAKYGDNMYSPSTWKHVKEDILSLHVEASHYKNEGKTYRKRFVVHGLSHNSADKEMIADINKSIAKYFKERYGIDLKYPELPCVKTKKDRDEYMPMELLEVLPFQNAKEDPGVIASAIIRCAAVRPADRFGNLREFVRSMNWRASLISKLRLGLRDMNPIKVEARELPQPSAHFSTGTVELGRGSWNQEPFHQPVPRSLRCVVVTMVPGYTRNVNLLMDKLPQAAQRFGVHMEMRREVVKSSIANLPKAFEDLQKEGVKLAIFVLTGTNEYPHIKRQGELHSSMFTQCVKDGTIRKPNVCNNLMLKINAKLGGINWVVEDLCRRRSDELLMVVGADVTHPGPTGGGRSFTKSVAAVVASISCDLMRYVAIVRQQDQIREGKSTREDIDGMEGIFSDLLKTFAKNNNDRLPTKVIVYRDGVSEGQFDPVLRIELSAMQRACSNLRPDYEPGITFIVVQKRHHIRFNPVGSRAKNVLPGTVVDAQITHHREFDFYLCSHEGIQVELAYVLLAPDESGSGRLCPLLP